MQGEGGAAVSESVMLACGCRSMAVHSGDHDGLGANHPSCVVHALDNKDGCIVVPAPDLTGRLAHCTEYLRKWGRNFGPIYPDDKTHNDGQCANGVCMCVVPSSMGLPFLKPGGELWDQRCAFVAPDGPCRYGPSQHNRDRMTPSSNLRTISIRYPKSHCSQCGNPMKIGDQAQWEIESKYSKHSLYHPHGSCPPLLHDIVRRMDIGEDVYYCGCFGWD